MNEYKCRHCGRTVIRNSNKEWIKSYCESVNKYVHIIKNKVK